jgi:hypothetical protein
MCRSWRNFDELVVDIRLGSPISFVLGATVRRLLSSKVSLDYRGNFEVSENQELGHVGLGIWWRFVVLLFIGYRRQGVTLLL